VISDTSAVVYLLLFGRLTLGSVFAFSSVTKLATSSAFVDAVRRIGVLPHRLVRPVAMTVVVAELGIAIALLIGTAIKAALVLALVLLFLFSLVLVWSLSRGRQVTCRCFGGLSTRPASWAAVLRNTLLGMLALVTLASARRDPGAFVLTSLPAADVIVTGLLALTTLALLALIGEAGTSVRGLVLSQPTHIRHRNVT
jgi:uncharacterized membrane protein YphA (DoxX/SURF4 family)